MVPVLLHSTVNHPSQLVACTQSLQSQHANNLCLLLLKACSSMPLILLKRHNSILYSDYLFNGLPLISEIHLLLLVLVECNIICVQKNMDHHQTLGKGPGGPRYKCTYMYAHLYILLCFGSLRDPPTPCCTKVYLVLLCDREKYGHPPPKWYFCTENAWYFCVFGAIGTPTSQNFYKNFAKKFDKELKKIEKI